jgi:hypothetical protein
VDDEEVMVRYRVKPGRAEENEALVRAVYKSWNAHGRLI